MCWDRAVRWWKSATEEVREVRGRTAGRSREEVSKSLSVTNLTTDSGSTDSDTLVGTIDDVLTITVS